MSLKQQLVEALIKEISIRDDFGFRQMISSIYFGGGTPSVLEVGELQQILDCVYKHYSIDDDVEITLESNPDDLDLEYLQELKTSTPINRLSIGIQSFFDEDLKAMNRAHNADHARKALSHAKDVGFDNITTDLIFGSQSTSNKMWEQNLKEMIAFDIPHLSIYGLTVEPKTALAHFIAQGKMKPLEDDKYFEQFSMTQEILGAHKYDQYEISNYARDGKISRHNSSYWHRADYLGIGPSSHSYYDGKRRMNINSNAKYLEAINSGEGIFEEEILSSNDQFNEYIMTGLRLKSGCNLEILDSFDSKYKVHFEDIAQKLMHTQRLIKTDSAYIIPDVQRIFTDRITQELFYVD